MFTALKYKIIALKHQTLHRYDKTRETKQEKSMGRSEEYSLLIFDTILIFQIYNDMLRPCLAVAIVAAGAAKGVLVGGARVQLQQPRRQGLQEGPVVGDQHQRRVAARQRRLHPPDRLRGGGHVLCIKAAIGAEGTSQERPSPLSACAREGAWGGSFCQLQKWWLHHSHTACG